MGLLKRVVNSLRDNAPHQDAADELAFHLEQRTAEHIRSGLSTAEAEALARRQLGNLTRITESTAEADVTMFLEGLRRDVKLCLRMLRRTPAVTLVAVCSLALGIGANTMVFTVAKQVLLDSLPVPHPEQLVVLHNPGNMEGHVSSDGMQSSFSYPLYQDLARTTHAIFSGLLARRQVSVTLARKDGSERVRCDLVSGNFFSVLRVNPWRGRLLTANDNQKPGAHTVAVLSYGYWQRAFAGDPNAIGQTVRLNTHPYKVVGIAPLNFNGVHTDSPPDLYVPIMMKAQMMPTEDRLFDRLNHWAIVMGRLQPGVSLAQAQAALRVIYPPLRDQDLAVMHNPSPEFREAFARNHVELTPGGRGYSDMRISSEKPLHYVSAMALIVLLITIVNVANLLVARGVAREREMAVRVAVGAGRPVLIRQLLTESTVLALVGGGLGIAFAFVGTPALFRLLSSDVSEASLHVHPDPTVLIATVLVSLVAGIAFGLLPALHAARTDVAHAMRADGSTGHTGGRLWLRRLLVGAQIAFSLVLLTASLLFVRSLHNLKTIDTGFSTQRLFSFKLDPVGAGYSQVREFQLAEKILSALAQSPDIESAGMANTPVLEGDGWGSNITVAGFRAKDRNDADVLKNAVSAQFLPTLRIPLRAGRPFSSTDMLPNSRVAIVNEAFVKKFLGGKLAIGSHFMWGSGDKTPEWTIIGVVSDSRSQDLQGSIDPFVYMPYTFGDNLQALIFYVRTRGEPHSVMTKIRRLVARTDASVPLFGLQTMNDLISDNLSVEGGLAVLSTAFAALAVALAAVGLYGVVSYSVTRRRREFGIRMAVGANASSVVVMILRETTILACVSLFCAVPAVLILGRLVQSSLYGVQPNDPMLCSAAVFLLLVVAVAASALPAINAAGVPPQVALRSE